MEWQVLKDGKIIRTGRVDDLKIAPQETAKITLNIGKDLYLQGMVAERFLQTEKPRRFAACRFHRRQESVDTE